MGVAYSAERDHPKPEFLDVFEDPAPRPKGIRIAFWADSVDEVNRIGEIAQQAGAQNFEVAAYDPEYSPT